MRKKQIFVLLVVFIFLNVASVAFIFNVNGAPEAAIPTPEEVYAQFKDGDLVGIDGTERFKGMSLVTDVEPDKGNTWFVPVINDWTGYWEWLGFECVLSDDHANIWIGQWDDVWDGGYQDSYDPGGAGFEDDIWYFAYPWSSVGANATEWGAPDPDGDGYYMPPGYMDWITGADLMDIMDEFEETIIDGNEGLQYVYGTEKRKVETIPVKLSYKTDAGMKENTYEVYRTHHGPITHSNGDKWVATAMMWDPVKALQQSFIRTKQEDHQGFRKMMDIRTNSSNNTVFADASGNIAYYHGNFIPKRNDTLDYTLPVDGSNHLTDWQGLHEVDENILIVNPETGWIQNCNSTPFTSAGDDSPRPENYPAYMTSFPENYRGVHAISLLRKADDLTLDKLIELAYDPFLPGGKELVEGLIEAAASSGISDPRQVAALEVLKAWDFKVNVNSVAMTLAQFYLNAYKASGYASYYGRDFMRMVRYMSKESPARERLEIFNKALDRLESDFGTWKTAWGAYNRYQRLNGDIAQKFNDELPSIPIGMASGSWGALASFSATYGENTKRIYGVHGNSFVAVVEFGEKISAKSLLAGGQSGDPDSVHFSDQVELYAQGQFKTVAFYRYDVLKRAESVYHPGEVKQSKTKPEDH